MKKRSIKIGVPKPCTENWDGMSETEKGRYCSSCQKDVIDFSHLTDRELFKELEKLKFKSACGRFSNFQLETEIKTENLPNTGFQRYRAAAAIFAGVLAIVPNAVQAQDKSAIVSNVGFEEQEKKGRQIVLQAKVVGKDGQPIKNARVNLGDTFSVETDTTGYFEIAYAGKAENLDLYISNERRTVHKSFSVSLTDCADGHSCISDLVFELPIAGWRKELDPSKSSRTITTGFFIVE